MTTTIESRTYLPEEEVAGRFADIVKTASSQEATPRLVVGDKAVELSVNRFLTLIDAEDWLFKRAPASFSRTGPSTNPSGAKETFINLNHTKYLFFL